MSKAVVEKCEMDPLVVYALEEKLSAIDGGRVRIYDDTSCWVAYLDGKKLALKMVNGRNALEVKQHIEEVVGALLRDKKEGG